MSELSTWTDGDPYDISFCNLFSKSEPILYSKG